MTHTEQIQVYRYTRVATDSGGGNDGTPVLQELAPIWATIEQSSGNDREIDKRNATESIFTVTFNYPLTGFRFTRDMFITTRFGNLDITNIEETQRKRIITLTGARIEGVSDSGGTGGDSDGAILTLYQQATPGATTITNSLLIGADILLAFRDGIGKEVVNVTPTKAQQMQFDGDAGTFALTEGDIFGDELITVLYKSA